MTMALSKKLKDKAAKAGIKLPEVDLNLEQQVDLEELIDGGGTQAAVDALLGVTPPTGPFQTTSTQTPTAAGVAPPAESAAPPPPAAVPMFTLEQVQSMMADMAKNIVAETIKAMPNAGHSISTPTEIRMVDPKEKKPTYPPKTGNIPEDKFNKEGVTFFHSGQMFTFDAFLIGGRSVEIPRSILIMFREEAGANIVRFGDVSMIQYTCKYTTHDQREIDMFRQDVRFGSEFWDGSGRSVTRNHVGVITARHIQGMNGLNFEAVKQMAIDRGIPISNLENMRAEVAIYDGMKEYESYATKAQSLLDAAEKENLIARKEAALAD